jgi:hypothetical protein
MAISFVAAGTVATGTNPSVGVPAGISANDLLLIITCGTATPTIPTGWTQVSAEGAGQFITVLRKFATSSEASVSLTQAGTTTKAVMVAYRGVGNTDVVSTYATGTSGSPKTNSQNTTFANDYVISIYAAVNSSIAPTWTADASTTSRVNSAVSAGSRGLLVADEAQASAGASAQRTATLSSSVLTWAAVSVSIRVPQTLYWVGGSGTWDATSKTPWATTSGGSGSQAVPGTTDNITIDNSSGTGTITCTAGVCANLTATVTNALTLGAGSSTLSVYGNLTLPSGAGSFSASANNWTMTFAAYSSKTITSNGYSLPNITFDGVGGTWALNDALTMDSAKTLTHSGGTLNLNGKTLTVGTAYTTATSTVKNLTFNGGTLVCPNSGATAFNNASPTNYTTTAGTGTGYISMTSASAKTFVGGGSTFKCTLQQTGAGALTITGANTFNDIANTVQPATVTFPASTTNTFTSGFSLSGTSGNLLTINSSSAGTAATISKASGTVSVSYCSIQDSAATGGATWNAFTTNGNVNVSGNSGWNFGTAATTNFLMFFSY